MTIDAPTMPPECDDAVEPETASATGGDGRRPMPGQGYLSVGLVHSQSAMVGCWSTSPLKLLIPRARGQSVWSYTSNLGGGYVAGDVTRMDLRVGRGARAFVGSQSSTKVYKNPDGLPCGSAIHAVVESGGLLVLAPEPVQAFGGAQYSQVQEFRLASDSSLVLVDWFTAGRAACGERWAFSQFASRNTVWRNAQVEPEQQGTAGELSEGEGASSREFLDAVRLEGDKVRLANQHRLGRFDCFALVVLLGPLVRDVATRLREEITARPVERTAALLTCASALREGAVLRVAGEAVEMVSAELRRYLGLLEPLLGDDPWTRKP
jgi:urease accessory protein